MSHESTPRDPLPVLALVRDLIFASKLTGTAKDLARPLKLMRDPATLGTTPGLRLLVDLNLPGAIEAAALWKTGTGGQVVGFVSHVDAQTAARAREAGIDRVMARSQFVLSLAELICSPDSG